ncbi:MAG: hypothetical protein K0S51_1101 [Bacillales bacterium]|jgi:hypothetical protein|nr:hypothetical protein [Bacillales bacterium]
MSRKTFDSISEEQLVHACFEPIIPRIMGKSKEVKEEVYNDLSKGQQEIFMFIIYYNHASKSIEEYCWWTKYYYNQPKVWIGIKAALDYFCAKDMFQHFEELEGLFKKDSNAVIKKFREKFTKISQPTINIIGRYIRNNSEDFVDFS